MKYVVALRREARADAPEDWPARVAEIPGVVVESEVLFGRMTVEADAAAADRLRAALGAYCHVEPVLRYDTQSEDDASGSAID